MLPKTDDNLFADDPAALYTATVDHFLAEADRGRLALRVPPPVLGRLPDATRAALHHTPEIFFQLQGATHFVTPGLTFRLMPGQVAVIPPLVAHEETAMRWAGEEFANVVIMLHHDCILAHLAGSDEQGVPNGRDIRRYSAFRLDQIRTYLADVIDARFSPTTAANQRATGAMLAAMGHIRDTLDRPADATGHEHPTVTLCRNIAVRHLSNPDMNVRELAGRVGCSADYLSNLFRRNVGVRLTAWLNAQRVEQAKYLLRTSRMNISEVAWATGYQDPGYLARRFRAETGLSPREYRARHAAT